ncbi:MAG: redoxin domain-containing protein [Promethearchaeota archaeon]
MMKLSPHDILPVFDLPEAGGKKISVWDYKGRRNLVLFFVHPDCRKCQDMLKELSDAYREVIRQESEVLAIIPASPIAAAELKSQLSIPFPVLADEAGGVFQRYGAVDSSDRPTAAVIIADRFGEVYAFSLAAAEHRLISVKEIIDFFNFIGIQCPECGAPEWPM